MKYLIILIPIILAAFIYQTYRAHMVKTTVYKDKNPKFYSFKTILKNFCIGLSLESLAILYAIIITQYLKITPNKIIAQIAIIIFSFAMATYTTSITLEQFVLNKLKETEEYKTLRIAIKAIHGPISHILIYLSLLLFFISLEFSCTSQITNENILSFIIIGSIYGVLLAFAQFINQTFKHQLILFALTLVINSILLIFSIITITEIFVLFETALITATIILLVKTKKATYYLYEKNNLD